MADQLALGVTRTFPPELVDRELAECGRVEQPHRLLPASPASCPAGAMLGTTFLPPTGTGGRQ
jgi:hypothetical protein